jgi:hypothetical protein
MMKSTLTLTLSLCFFASAAAEAQLGEPAQVLANRQQSNVPAEVRQAEDAVERTARRLRAGVAGGVGLDPELIMFGAHATFGPVVRRGIDFRPGVEVGLGELTTLLAINLDVLYTFGANAGDSEWVPYIGAGPSMGLSHRGFDTTDENPDNVDVEQDGAVAGRNRFDFSDTDFNGGMNFIAGARRQNGLFVELKATAWGVSNIRVMAGFNF